MRYERLDYEILCDKLFTKSARARLLLILPPKEHMVFTIWEKRPEIFLKNFKRLKI